MTFFIKPISNKHLWEKYNLSSPFPSLFQSWNMGEALKKQGCQVVRLGLYQEKQLRGIAQVVKVEARRGNFLHIRGGPILNNIENLTYFLPLIRNYFKKENVWFLRISPLILKSDNKANHFLQKLGFQDAPIPFLDAEATWLLDITKDEQTLLSQMRKTTRYLIKKAQKMGVVVTLSQEQASLNDLLYLYKIMVKEKGIIPHQGIAEEFQEMVKDDQAVIIRGYYGEKLLGAALIIFYADEAIYHHSAFLRTPKNVPVSYLLQWRAILEAKRRKKKKYNFWGIEPTQNPHHPWYGLTLFKMGFGGYQRQFIRAKDLPFSSFYYFTKLIESLRRIKRYRIFI